MAVIDLISEYGNRNIEGADIGDIIRGLNDEGKIFKRDEIDYTSLIHIPTGRRIVLKCIMNYFEPTKAYFKLHKKAQCDFVKRAMGVDTFIKDCHHCLRHAYEHRLVVKPSKFRVANDYYFK